MKASALLLAGAALTATAAPVASPDLAVTYIPAVDVGDAFAKGRPLLETEGYKIHASRREAPGMAEIHQKDTDIIYVLEGGATIVTGGEVVDVRTVAPGELRGASIRGGTSRRLARGDVFVVPHGVPHWFREVDAPFLYYVVKSTRRGDAQ